MRFLNRVLLLLIILTILGSPGLSPSSPPSSAVAAAVTAEAAAEALPADKDVPDSPAAAAEEEGEGKPLVTSAKLAHSLTRRALNAHGQKLMQFAAVGAGKTPNRAFGGPGHRLTVDYIKAQLDATGFYRTTLQKFVHLYSTGESNFAAGRAGQKLQIYPSSWFTYGPPGNVTQPIVNVADLGCKPVRAPPPLPIQRREGGADYSCHRPTSRPRSRAASP